GISSDVAIRSRMRSISRPMMNSSLRSTTGSRPVAVLLLLAELPLPIEDLRPRRGGLGLGDHPLHLVELRQARVREDVVGRELAEALRDLDGLVELTELLVRHGERVDGVDVRRVERERAPVLLDRAAEVALEGEIEPRVVELLLVRHRRDVTQRVPGRQAWVRRRRAASRLRAMPSLDEVVADVLRFIALAAGDGTGAAGPSPREDRDDDAAFDALVREVFELQLRENRAYRAFCERRGVRAEEVRGWRDVPAVPAAAFKELDLACAPPERVFLTSGTTRGHERRGRHPVPRLALYRASAIAHFRRMVLPDGAVPRMVGVLAG